MPINTIIDPDFECFAGKSVVQIKRGSYKITIQKVMAVGAGLKQGKQLYCYYAKDHDNRPMLALYLDGEERKTKFNRAKFEFENDKKNNKTNMEG